MSADCKRYTASCLGCQRSKPRGTTKVRGIHVAERLQKSAALRPWHSVGVDCYTVGGNAKALTVRDDASGLLFAFELRDGSAEAVRAHLEAWLSSNPVRHCRSDRGSEFLNSTISEMCERVGVKWHPTAAGHAAANGGAERPHLDYTKLVPALRADFPELSLVQLVLAAARAHNESSAGSAQFSPMYLAYGRAGRQQQPAAVGEHRGADEQVALHEAAWRLVYESKAADAAASSAQMSKGVHYTQFRVGSPIMLYLGKRVAKGRFHWSLPHVVTKVLSDQTYECVPVPFTDRGRAAAARKRKIVHVSRCRYYSAMPRDIAMLREDRDLRALTEAELQQRIDDISSSVEAAPDDDDGQQEWEVIKITDSAVDDVGELWFFTTWSDGVPLWTVWDDIKDTAALKSFLALQAKPQAA